MKAVLVVEIKADELPKDAHASVYVYGKYSEEQEDDFLANMKNVPLKPMPKRKEYTEPKELEDYKVSQMLVMANADGWNACLKEITGETE